MDLSAYTFKQYPAKEQAELRVRIKVPGSWFDNLTPAESAGKYEAEAYESVEAHKFKKSRRGPERTCAAIKFLCEADVFEDPRHAGFIMPLDQWNRYRNDTYKDDREAEVPYIRTPAAAGPAAAAPAAAGAVPSRPLIFSEFDFVESGTHEKKTRVRGGEARIVHVPCEYWRCKNTSGKCNHRDPFKVVEKGSGKLFEHLEKCNPEAHQRISLGARTPCTARVHALVTTPPPHAPCPRLLAAPPPLVPAVAAAEPPVPPHAWQRRRAASCKQTVMAALSGSWASKRCCRTTRTSRSW